MIRRYLHDPDWPTLVLATCVALALAVLTLSGCGASALERHATAAGIMHAVANEAGPLIDAEAQAAAERAIAPCANGAQPVDVCDAELARVMTPRRRAADVQNLFASAVEGYVLAVLTAARDEDPDLSIAVQALGRVLAIYDDLRALLSEYGTSLPDPGPVVRALLGGGS